MLAIIITQFILLAVILAMFIPYLYEHGRIVKGLKKENQHLRNNLADLGKQLRKRKS